MPLPPSRPSRASPTSLNLASLLFYSLVFLFYHTPSVSSSYALSLYSFFSHASKCVCDAYPLLYFLSFFYFRFFLLYSPSRLISLRVFSICLALSLSFVIVISLSRSFSSFRLYIYRLPSSSLPVPPPPPPPLFRESILIDRLRCTIPYIPAARQRTRERVHYLTLSTLLVGTFSLLLPSSFYTPLCPTYVRSTRQQHLAGCVSPWRRLTPASFFLFHTTYFSVSVWICVNMCVSPFLPLSNDVSRGNHCHYKLFEKFLTIVVMGYQQSLTQERPTMGQLVWTGEIEFL